MDESASYPDLIDARQLLEQRFAGLGDGFGKVVAAWKEAVGEHIASVTMPTRLRDGELRVRCDSAAWTSELLHSAPAILRQLSATMGANAPLRLVPYTGRVQAPPPPEATPEPPQLPPLTAADRVAVEGMVEAIADGELKASLQRAIGASRRARRR